jgi:hypothetical protein
MYSIMYHVTPYYTVLLYNMLFRRIHNVTSARCCTVTRNIQNLRLRFELQMLIDSDKRASLLQIYYIVYLICNVSIGPLGFM